MKFDMVGREAVATVIEDRGPIGIGGRRLIRVRLEWAHIEPMEFELPAEEVTIVEE